MIKRLQNILSSTEPENKEVLWFHIFNGKVVQKLYLNGGWTSISSQGGGGGGDVDLSDYYTKPQVDSKFALKSSLSKYVTTKAAESFVTKSDLDDYIPNLSNYYTKNDTDNIFAKQGTLSAFNKYVDGNFVKHNQLQGYVYKAQLDEAINSLEDIYAKSNLVEGLVNAIEYIQNDYLTSQDLSNYVTISSLDNKLEDYTYSKSHLQLNYAKKLDLSNLDERVAEIEEKYVKSSQIADFVDSQTVDQLIYNAIKDLPTESDVQTIVDNSVDQAVQGLASEDYVTQQIEATLGVINAQLEEV